MWSRFELLRARYASTLPAASSEIVNCSQPRSQLCRYENVMFSSRPQAGRARPVNRHGERAFPSGTAARYFALNSLSGQELLPGRGTVCVARSRRRAHVRAEA